MDYLEVGLGIFGSLATLTLFTGYTHPANYARRVFRPLLALLGLGVAVAFLCGIAIAFTAQRLLPYMEPSRLPEVAAFRFAAADTVFLLEMFGMALFAVAILARQLEAWGIVKS
jgi:hypothetical protein